MRDAPPAGPRFLLRRRLWLALVVLACALVAASAAGQPAPRPVSPAPSAAQPAVAGAPKASVAAPVAAPSASSSTSVPSFDVRLHEKVVFSLHVPRSGHSPQDRARAASHALESVLDDPEQPMAHVEEQPGTADLFVGKTPVATLSDDDAAASGADVTLHVYAGGIATKIDDALRAERKRSAIATSVFSFAVLVSSGLLAFFLFRRVGHLSVRARAWVREHPDRIPALKLGRIEVVRPVAVRGAVSIALALAHRLAQFAILYSWLIFAL